MSATSLPTDISALTEQNATGYQHWTLHNLLNKFANQTYNVTDSTYGAVADNSTDDSTAIQAAIDAAGTAGGGIVLIPAGTYRIDTGLVLDTSRVALIGAGSNVATLNYHGSGIAIQVTCFENTLVKGLKVTDSATNGTKGYALNYSAATTSFMHEAEDLDISGFTTGFECSNIELFRAEHIRVSSAGTGFLISNDDHTGGANGISNQFIRCRAISCTGDGWDVNDQSSSEFIGCQGLLNGATNAQAFFRGNCVGLTIEHIDVENDDGTTVGLLVSGTRHTISYNAVNVLTGCSLSTCTNSVILPSRSSTVTTNLSLTAASTGNTIIGVSTPVSDSGVNNVFIGAGDAPLQRLVAWVADDAQNPSMGTLPEDSYVTNVIIQVTEAFDSDGTDNITVGYDASTNAFATSTDVSTTGIKTVTLGSLAGYNSTSRAVEAYYVNGGTEPSNGKALVVLEYYRVPTEVA